MIRYLVSACLLVPSLAWADDVTEVARINVSAGNQFGLRIDAEDDVLAISPRKTGGRSLYIFRHNGTAWVQQAFFTETEAVNAFYSVEVDNGRVYSKNAQTKTVREYTFNGSSWSVSSQWTVPSPASECAAEFAVHNGWMAVACAPNAAASFGGAIYVYQRQVSGSWTLTSTIPSVSGAITGNAWADVDIHDDVIVASDIFADPSGQTNAGTVYVYRRSGSTWGLEQSLSPGVANDQCGRWAQVETDVLAFGCRLFSGTSVGRVVVYRRAGGTWTLDEAIDGTTNGFGYTIALEDESLLVGDNAATVATRTNAGEGRVYDGSQPGWPEVHRLRLATPSNNDVLGSDSSMTGGVAFLSAIGHAVAGGTGAVFDFGSVGGPSDSCPTDPDKMAPGLCGCDYFDLDLDLTPGAETCQHRTAMVGDRALIEPGATLHANAVVAPRARIGGTAVVGAGASVGRRAVVNGSVGANVFLAADTEVESGASVGSGVTVGFGARIRTGSSVGDGAVIGNLVQITGSVVGANVEVGREAQLTSATVGADVEIGPDVWVLAGAVVEPFASLGGGSQVRAGAHVGEWARLAKGVVVDVNAGVGDRAIVRGGLTIPTGRCVPDDQVVRAGDTVPLCP
jgi:carbonic anhydrase/acetyltransferase-like protein (isoleucine patch superfamily)